MSRRTRLGAIVLGGLLAAGVVSAQPAMTTVPPTTRVTVEQATAIIEAAGLTVGAIVEDPRYVLLSVRVVGSIPPSHTVVEVGSAVTLRVSVVR